ncbi:MAG: 50S ribosomal protein L18 [Candidatus Levyibacteriota bacterium]|nr:MAG: 50S ribosomal protein L18 [Candidatus Levybacteria bacterium]
MNNKNQKLRRRKRVRARVKGSKEMPRLSVFRSNRYFYGQLINDEKAATIVGVSEKELENKKAEKTERAKKLGQLMAKKAIGEKIKKVVFDKGSNKYHGRVKAFADGAREGGLVF